MMLPLCHTANMWTCVHVYDRENFHAVFQLTNNYCFVFHPVDDYSIEVLLLTLG